MTKCIECLNIDTFARLNKETQKEEMRNMLKEYRARTQKKEVKMYECEICMGEFPRNEMYRAACGDMFCMDCWKDNFRTHVNTSTETFSCMQTGCGLAIEYNTIVEQNMHDGDQKLLTAYSTQVTFSAYQDKIKECPKCFSKVFLTTDNMKVSCPVCKFDFCRECRKTYHPDYPTCGEYMQHLVALQRAENEKIEYNNDIKPCPNPACHVSIYKDGGCQWMHCDKCGSYFCWVCMQVTNNHQHRPGQVCTPHGKLV